MSEDTLSGAPGPPSPLPGRRARSRTESSGSRALPIFPRPQLHRSEPVGPSQPTSSTSSSGGTAAASDASPSAGASGARGEGKSGRRSRRRGGRRSKAASSGAPEGSAGPSGDGADAASPRSGEGGGGGSESAAPARKRSRRRGGRKRSSKATGGAESPEGAEVPSAAGGEGGDGGSSSGGRKSARRSRRGSGRGSGEASESGEAGGGASEGDEAASGKKAKRSGRKRGSRGGRGRKKRSSSAVEIETIPGEEDELPELEDLPDDAVLLESGGAEGASKSKRAKRSRKRSESTARTKTKGRSSKASKASKADSAPAEPLKPRQILVNACDPEETRVAVVEDGRIVELQMTVRKHTSYVSDIYRGRVVNIESAIGAAFVDFGQGRNGFLHASDVLPSYGDPDWSLEQLLSTPVEQEELEESAEEPDEGEAKEAVPPAKAGGKPGRGRGRDSRAKRVRTPIDKLVKKGQMVAVQITKDAIGDKGPTLTTYVSIPGRYLVLMPSLERTGVSRKIEDEKERRRLKRILSALEIPEGMGVIVRTAGIGKTKTELARDLDYLLLAWDDFSARLVSGRNPAPLYQESDVAIRTMRDLFTSQTEVVLVDDEAVHNRMVEFTKRLMPEHVERIKRHEGPRPLFQSHGVEQDFEKIFQRRVELPSGGSIVIDQTEALVAIDVNSGRTREAGAEFEDIALKTNLEAVAEIARQIRLRDLGGIIVLDYIDMMRASSRRQVEKATSEAIKHDRARSKVGRISQFGLLELTRQRLGPGLNKLVYDTCARCKGSGRRRNAPSRAQAILRRLGASLALKGFTSVEVRAHPEVIEYLERELQPELKRLEEFSGRNLVLMSVPDQAEDSVLHYLRADGREVRPGGRRKR